MNMIYIPKADDIEYGPYNDTYKPTPISYAIDRRSDVIDAITHGCYILGHIMCYDMFSTEFDIETIKSDKIVVSEPSKMDMLMHILSSYQYYIFGCIDSEYAWITYFDHNEHYSECGTYLMSDINYALDKLETFKDIEIQLYRAILTKCDLELLL